MTARAESGREWRWAIVGGSLLAHVVALFVLGVGRPRTGDLSPPDPEPIRLELFRHRLIQVQRAQHPAPLIASKAAAPAVKQHVPSLPSTSSPTQAFAPAPIPAMPSLPPGAFGSGFGHGLVRGAAGCDLGYGGHQTQEQRAKCDQGFGEAAKLATPFSAIPEKKRAYYDAIQRQYMLSHETPIANRARGAGPVGAASAYADEGALIRGQVAGHGPGIGCGMKLGGGPTKKDTRTLEQKIKEDGMIAVGVGPLKCAVVLPQGSLTPEIGIKPP